jgi:hypothetical protein
MKQRNTRAYLSVGLPSADSCKAGDFEEREHQANDVSTVAVALELRNALSNTLQYRTYKSKRHTTKTGAGIEGAPDEHNTVASAHAYTAYA